jgi:excisionase family DNA binding protein
MSKASIASSVPLRDRLAVTIQEACQAAGLGPTVLYGLIHDGAIETVRIGRRRLVLVRSLVRLIEGDRSEGAADGKAA